MEDVSSQSEIQVIKWELTLPDEVKMMGASEGTVRIYTTQRDFVGLAPLVMVGNSLKILKKSSLICKKKKTLAPLFFFLPGRAPFHYCLRIA